MTTDQPAAGYVPGVCNINSAEVAYRRKAGYIMLAITLAVAVVLVAATVLTGLNQWFRLIIFFPAFVTAVCMLQVKYKFCVNYGANGMQHAVETDAETQAVVDEAARKLDQARTRKIKLQAATIGLAVAVVFAALPL